MTFDEMMSVILDMFPDAEIGDENGEIVIATGMARDDNDQLISVVNV